MNPLLAIVIPYYNIHFFEDTLKSVAAQSNKNFRLYIGNDASPNDPLLLIQRYFPAGDYRYFDYTENVGGTNLALQWERILENVSEDWFQILCDDDVISDNFVEEFYRHINCCENVDFIKFASKITDENGNTVFSAAQQIKSGLYSPVNFFLDKLDGKINSSLSEHIFCSRAFRKCGFKKYPLAWHADDAIQLEINRNLTPFYFISETIVTIKETSKSISGKTDNRNLKNEAQLLFYNDALTLLRTANKTQKDHFAKYLTKKIPQIPAKKVFLELFDLPSALRRLIKFYINRIINKYMPWREFKSKVLLGHAQIVYRIKVQTDRTIRRQRKNPLTIPVIIINFNQLKNLKGLVKFLLDRGFINIIIIDNHSDYQPLLDYYEEIKKQVKIELRKSNDGHMVFFEDKNLQAKYAKGYFFLTDADVIPNVDLPMDFVQTMIALIEKYFLRITKVGFALRIDDIPEYYPLKEKVQKWESRYWRATLEQDVYNAEVDTTFALYKPGYQYTNREEFLKAVRVAGNFTARHMGWYINSSNYSAEQQHYFRTVNSSSSWRIDREGNHLSTEYNRFIT